MSSIAAGTTTTTGYVVTSDSTGALVLKTGASATTAMTIDTSQNVGIGTSSPSQKLAVDGNITSTAWLGRSNGSAPTADCAIYRAADNTLGFSTGSTERARIDSSGNFNVYQTIDINRSGASGAIGFRRSNTYEAYITGINGGGIEFQVGSGLANNVRIDASGNMGVGTTTLTEKLNLGGNLVFRQSSNITTSTGFLNIAPTSTLILDSGDSIHFRIASSERMRLNSSGNLVVGNSSVFPSPSLINVVTASGIACGFAFSDNTAGLRGRLWWGGGTDGVSLFNEDNSPLRFGTTGAERARFDSAGNFMIGTTTQYSSLTVQGGIRGFSNGLVGGVVVADSANTPATFARMTSNGSDVAWGQNIVTYPGTWTKAVTGSPSGGWVIGNDGSAGYNQSNAGDSSPLQYLRFSIDANGANFYNKSGTTAVFIRGQNASGSNAELQLVCPGSNSAAITYVRSSSQLTVVNGGGGGVYLAGSGTSWIAISDERKKENLVPITDAVNKVLGLRAVTGNYIADPDKKSKAFLIAQDVQAVLPEAVDNSDPETLGLAYTDTIPLLVAAIKEQQALIETLTQRITALEGR